MVSIEILLILSVAASVIATLLSLIALKLGRDQKRAMDVLTQRISRDVAVANSGTVGMGQRLMALEKKLAEAAIDKRDLYQEEEFEPYSQAAQLFQMGIECDEVARRCGLSRAEASLLQIMQQSGR
jgi:hypothetical protein